MLQNRTRINPVAIAWESRPMQTVFVLYSDDRQLTCISKAFPHVQCHKHSMESDGSVTPNLGFESSSSGSLHRQTYWVSLTLPARGIRKGSVQNTNFLARLSRLVLTAMESSIGSSGGMTLVMIMVQFKNSLKRFLSGSYKEQTAVKNMLASCSRISWLYELTERHAKAWASSGHKWAVLLHLKAVRSWKCWHVRRKHDLVCRYTCQHLGAASGKLSPASHSRGRSQTRTQQDEQKEDEETSLPIVSGDPLCREEDCPHELTCVKENTGWAAAEAVMMADRLKKKTTWTSRGS